MIRQARTVTDLYLILADLVTAGKGGLIVHHECDRCTFHVDPGVTVMTNIIGEQDPVEVLIISQPE